MRPTVLALPLLVLAGLGAASIARAQIKSFTLEEMVQTADQAVFGQIVDSRVTKVVSPDDGTDNYFTTLTLQGVSLNDQQPITVDVTFRGGFINETEGVFNSEAPAADDVAIGKRVVVFYRWADDIGGGMAANAIVAAHGGIYRTVETARGAAVLGRGEGYAIRNNRYVEQLAESIRVLAKPR